jgi:hypothetical protein
VREEVIHVKKIKKGIKATIKLKMILIIMQLKKML